jgi:hypothetical protein
VQGEGWRSVDATALASRSSSSSLFMVIVRRLLRISLLNLPFFVGDGLSTNPQSLSSPPAASNRRFIVPEAFLLSEEAIAPKGDFIPIRSVTKRTCVREVGREAFSLSSPSSILLLFDFGVVEVEAKLEAEPIP